MLVGRLTWWRKSTWIRVPIYTCSAAWQLSHRSWFTSDSEGIHQRACIKEQMISMAIMRKTMVIYLLLCWFIMRKRWNVGISRIHLDRYRKIDACWQFWWILWQLVVESCYLWFFLNVECSHFFCIFEESEDVGWAPVYKRNALLLMKCILGVSNETSFAGCMQWTWARPYPMNSNSLDELRCSSIHEIFNERKSIHHVW